MSAVDRLYTIDNKATKNTINIEDKLYKRLMKFIKRNYDATFSEVVNVCIEEYIQNNNPKFYEKPKMETVTYRSIMFREKNLRDIRKMHKRTGIPITRLVNRSCKRIFRQI